MIQFDQHIFQMGWNHHLQMESWVRLKWEKWVERWLDLQYHSDVLNTTSLRMTMQALQTPAIIPEKSIFLGLLLHILKEFLVGFVVDSGFLSSPSSVGMIPNVKGLSDAESIGGVRGWDILICQSPAEDDPTFAPDPFTFVEKRGLSCDHVP